MDSALLALVADWTLRLTVTAIILARPHGTPAVRVAWILVTLALPYLGALLYLAYGEVWSGRGAVARNRASMERVRALLPPPPPQTTGFAIPKGLELMRRSGGSELTIGNRLELVSETDSVIDRMAQDIDRASSTCHVETYIYLPDGAGTRLAEALLGAARRSVQCRLLVDALGSKIFLKSDLCKRLRASEVEVRASLPVRMLRPLRYRADHRNHRKITVVDGCIGWTGSQNVADAAFAIKPAFAPWVDVMVRLEGPAARDLQAIFVADWCAEGDDDPGSLLTPIPEPYPDGLPVQVFGTGPGGDPYLMRELSLLAFARAETSILITTPYFVPDEATVSALYASARAGVDVKLVLPARNDSRLVGAASRSFYDNLLASGVEILEFLPGLLHSKTIALDDAIAVVASANLDRRSFELNYEVNMVVLDESFTQELRALQESYIRDSRPVQAKPWKGRGFSRRVRENLAGMLAPLL